MNKKARILVKKGRKLEAAGNYVDAISAYEAALGESSQNPDILFALGNIARKMDILPVAEEMFRTVYGLLPDSIEAATNLALTIADQHRTDEAIEIYKSILNVNPEHVGTWVNIGIAVASTGDFGNAEIFYREALKFRPSFTSALTNLSELLAQKDDFEGALKLADKALKRDKRNAIIRFNRGQILLSLGRLEEGWPELEFGAQNRKDRQVIYHHKIKIWKGDDLENKKILLSCEQGLADQLRFLNCVDDIIQMADQVIIETDPRLVELLGRTYPGVEVKPFDHKKIANVSHFHYDWPVDELDYASPMLNLYRYLKPDIESFSENPATFITDETLDKKWQKKIDEMSDGLKVGICWRSGTKSLKRNREYSDISDWGPILAQKNVTFFNLMYDDCAGELDQVKSEFGVDIITFDDLDYKDDLENVFSLTKQMDIVISANTAPASIAGVLGIPTYMPCPNMGWDMLGTDHMAMVPCMKPIIQAEKGNWEPVIEQLAGILKTYIT